MSARTETLALLGILNRRGIPASFEDANTLRRAEKTLSRWYELECGDSNNFYSWAIERDEATGTPYLVTHTHDGKPPHRQKVSDRERGAIRRVSALCRKLTMDAPGRYHSLPVPKPIPIYFYVQSDPRGCCLYVGTEPLTDQNYSTHGVGCCV